MIIGAGPNGLVAANDLVDHGWDVIVLEAQPEPGGAVRSGEVLEPGFVTDRFSAFYPLGVVSPHLRRLQLDRWGLEWVDAPVVLAHPTPDGPAALLSRDIDVTAASLDRFAQGDGASWRALQADWDAIEAPLVDALMAPFPPMRAAGRLAVNLRLRGLGQLARRALLPVRRMADEHFEGSGGGLLLGGSALHADLTPETGASGFLGWMLAAIGQHHGWPVPRGGSGAITDALVRRFIDGGGRLLCDACVEHIEVSNGRARSVRIVGDERIAARRAVIADVVAPNLYMSLLDSGDVPARTLIEIGRYQRGAATFKVNWTLDAPVPWTDPDVGDAGTVHLAASLNELTIASAQLAMNHLPEHPFVLVGQMTTADATRSPPGTESLWAYTNVPQRVQGDAGGNLTGLDERSQADEFTERIEQRLETFAPGFTSRVRRRSIQTPASIESDDANLLGGDKSLGTAQLHQQLIFRPSLGLARAETPVDGLFLASASAHPGGGVHGACGANAARAAIAADRRRAVLHPVRHSRGPTRLGGEP